MFNRITFVCWTKNFVLWLWFVSRENFFIRNFKSCNWQRLFPTINKSRFDARKPLSHSTFSFPITNSNFFASPQSHISDIFQLYPLQLVPIIKYRFTTCHPKLYKLILSNLHLSEIKLKKGIKKNALAHPILNRMLHLSQQGDFPIKPNALQRW